MTVEGVGSEGRRLIASITIPFVLATVAFTLRIVSRASLGKIGADDWCGLVVFVGYIALYVASLIWVTNGYLGWPQSDLDDGQLQSYLKIAFTVEVLYTLVAPSVKLSVILLYSRIFGAKALRIPFIVAISAIAAWFVGAFIATFFQCSPITEYWSADPARKCINQRTLQLGTSSTNVILNAMIIFIPLPVILRCKSTFAEKVIIFAMLGVGTMIIVFSILRSYYLAQIDLISNNRSGTAVDAAIWTSVEPAMVIFCSSLPTSLSLFFAYRNASKQVRDDFSPTTSRSDSAGGADRAVFREGKNVEPRGYEKLPETYGEIPRDEETAYMGGGGAQRDGSISRQALYIPPDRMEEAHRGRYVSRTLFRAQKEFEVYRFSGYTN